MTGLLLAKRILRPLLEFAFNQLVGRLLLLGLAVWTSTAYVLDSDNNTLRGAVAVAATVALLLDQGKRLYEFRHEQFMVLRRDVQMVLTNGGQDIEYTVSLKIRSRSRGLTTVRLPLAWSGETDPADSGVAEGVGDDLNLNVTRDTSGWVRCEFTFDPLSKRKTRYLEVRLRLKEPALSYSPYIGFQAANYMWARFARLTFEVGWDNSRPIHFDSIKALIYRNPNEVMRGVAPLRTIQSTGLTTKKNGQGCQWRILPARSDRYYKLRWELTAGPTKGQSIAPRPAGGGV